MAELDETIYEHFRGDDTVTVTAAERWSIAMCKRLQRKYPDQVEIDHINKDGSMVVHIPFEWMRIVPKKKDTRSVDAKNKAAASLCKYQKPRSGSGEIEPISDETV